MTADPQIAAANAVARQLGGAAVDPAGTALPAVERPPGAAVTIVRLPGDHHLLMATAADLGRIVAERGETFRREDAVVTVDREKARLVPLTAQRFRSWVERYCVTANFRGMDESGKPKWHPRTMNRETALGVLESDAFLKCLPRIARVAQVSMPVMRQHGPDAGRIVLLPPGYDPASQVFTLDGEVAVRPDTPFDEARGVLRDLLKEFPFGDRDRDGNSRGMAAVVAAALSLFGIGLLGPLTSRMHFVFTANTVGSGKSLLAKIAICPVFGPARVRSKGENAEELRKELSTAALDGDSYFLIDDVDGMLRSQELNAFMTSSTVGGRMLGRLGGGFSAEKQCVVFITGNNLKLSTDIERRTLRVGLYSEEFDVQDRQISTVIDEAWLCRPDHRGRLLSALWALIREWDGAGRPRGGRELRGFEQWCATFGGIVVHAGFGDPCAPAPLDDNSGSNERADMLALVSALAERLATPQGEPARRREFTFQELVDVAQERDAFSWAMEGTWKKDRDSGEEWLELSQRSKSTLGKLWSERFGGQIFRLPAGRIRFGSRGRNRGRRYVLEAV